ncbi:hypothetical protein J19TS1_24200 [Heyndrickxia oleronia]|nr:hypothetical protein J19TS1_24200 [Heyndrickxia oleronia]
MFTLTLVIKSNASKEGKRILVKLLTFHFIKLVAVKGVIRKDNIKLGGTMERSLFIPS